MTSDPNILVSISDSELEALADGLLAPSAQSRLHALLNRNAERRLSDSEESELDRVLERVDQLTLLKTRARYTLQQRAGLTDHAAGPCERQQ